MSDNVNHPKHYNSGKIEVIEFIEDQGWGSGFCRGDVIKYVARAGKKDPTKEIEDLEKAAWYLAREIEVMKAAKEGRAPRRPNDMNERRSASRPFSSATPVSTSEPNEILPETAPSAPRPGPQFISEDFIMPGDPVEMNLISARVRRWGHDPDQSFRRFRYRGEWVEIHPEGQEACIVFLPYGDVDESLLLMDSAEIVGSEIKNNRTAGVPLDCPKCKRSWDFNSEQANSVRRTGECLVCHAKVDPLIEGVSK